MKSRTSVKCISVFLVIVIAFLMVMLPKEVNAEVEIPEEYIAYCEEIGEMYCISPELLEAMMIHESRCNPNVTSSAGCVGLMQVSPKWHASRMKRLGVTDLYDPYSNILVATDYLVELFEQYGDLPMVLMTYNGSSDAEYRWNTGKFTDYAKGIMEKSVELERLHGK